MRGPQPFSVLRVDDAAQLLRLQARVLESMAEGVGVADERGMILYTNPAEDALFGYRPGELVGKHVSVLAAYPPDELWQEYASIIAELQTSGKCIREARNRRKDGSELISHLSLSRLEGEGSTYTVWVREDITERKQAEESLARLAAIVAGSDDAIISNTLDGTIISWNPGAERLYGYTPGEVVGRSFAVIIPPDKQDEVLSNQERLRRGQRVPAFDTVRLHKDGRRIDVTVSISPVLDRQGQVIGASAITHDITEKRCLEEQLRQAQKMDAIGRLAGGVAHDFNNLLTVINGYGDIVAESLQADHPARELVEQICAAGERAAALTRQLLAFSRKTVLEPKVVDLNAQVREMEKLLRRLIGEDIDLVVRLDASLGRVKTDPSQLEQAVINLAVNARDAMPQGGRLIIETHSTELDDAYSRGHPDVRPGPYVLLMVRDTGHGMDETTKARIFEPFFTTKGPGQGTGLGLAMIYGFVQQSGGHIVVWSEPGRGAAFQVYLPRVEEAVSVLKSADGPVPLLRGTETILLVEDEDGVRVLARHLLRTCGYTVLEATHGRDAVRLAEHHRGRIDLLITDVVMPHGMGGRQVAEAVRALHPEVKVLFVSGYTDDAVVRHGVREAQTRFLPKPFTSTALAAKAREVLDENGEKPS